MDQADSEKHAPQKTERERAVHDVSRKVIFPKYQSPGADREGHRERCHRPDPIRVDAELVGDETEELFCVLHVV